MDYLLDLLQGLGIAAAIGIRPFLPTLLAGARAAQNLGLDFEITDFSVLETSAFLLVMLALVVVIGFLERRRISQPTRAILLASALVLGALLAAASIADHSETWWPGVPIGVAAASLGFLAADSLLGRVKARLDNDAAGVLPLFAEAAALVGCGLSILFPPLAVLVVAALAWLLLGGRRRQGEKYAGLRILR
jgi:hypothetical protein